MAPKDKKKAAPTPAQEPEEPEVDEATGLRLWKRVQLRMTLEADLKTYVRPPPPTPEELEAAAAAETEAAGKGKGKAAKGKGKPAAGAPAAKASSDPDVPARSLEVSWSSLSGRFYKWQSWEAEPSTEGVPPLTVEIDPEVEGCNPYEQLPTDISSIYSGSPKEGTYTLKCIQPLKTNETLINAMILSDCYIEIQLKQVTAMLAEVAEKEVQVQGALFLDCADLLLQDTALVKEWRDDGDPLTDSELPDSLKPEFSRVKMTLEVMSEPEKAVSQETTPLDEPAVPSAPCGLMTHDLASMLNPLVIRPHKVRDLPDFPATMDQIDEACYPMTLKYTFPVPRPARPTSLRGIPSAWRIPPDEDLLDDPSLRDCYFIERSILLLGDMDIDVFEQFCKEQPLDIQVHDRDAIPVEPEFTLKNVPPEFRKPPFWYPPPPVEESPSASRPGSKSSQRKMSPRKKTAPPPPPPEETETPEPPPPEDDDDEGEVFGSAKLSLADFVKGYTKIEADIQVQPATTIRGAAGLEWNTRPGRYLQAGSELSISLRLAVPLPEMKGKAYRPKVFNRIVFLMDYKDVELFLKIEKAVRACNIVTLGLLPPPSEQGESQGEAEEIDEIAAFQAKLEQEERERNPQEEDEDTGPKPPEPPAAKITTGHLQELKVSLYVQQQLSTYRLSDEERVDPDCDVLTGVHVVDSKFRMIILEGLQRGAMGLITMIAGWALRNRNAVEGGLQRQVLYNKSLRYPHRLFCNLGVNMWIIKIRSPLPKLIADPASWAQGMVREQCKEGVRRILMLTKAVFMRQVDENNWMPTDTQLTLVDKKFGGELTREDVLGYSRKSKRKARDVGLATMIEAVASAVDSSAADTERRQRLKAALDMDNTRYTTIKAEREVARAEIDWHKDYVDSLPVLTETMQPIRDEWATWNPQRAAAKELEAMVKTGQLTLEDVEAARREVDVEVIPGSIPRDEALYRGWYPHGKPFLWPSPKDPKLFNAHPNKPSESRIQELGYPWVEGEMFKPVGLRPVNAGGKVFQTIFGGEDVELFGKDPEYWKTVFISGDGLAEEIAADKKKEEEDWKRRVVVDDIIFRAVLHNRNASQLDRSELMLKDKPKKKGFKRTHIPSMPISIYLAEPHVENPGEDARPTVHTNETTKWMGGENTNFQRFIARDKTSVHRMGHSQAWGA